MVDVVEIDVRGMALSPAAREARKERGHTCLTSVLTILRQRFARLLTTVACASGAISSQEASR
mgnify:CR=1 FL=1